MSEEDEGGDKQHEPTQKKLDDARKKGDIVRANDLNTAAAYGGFMLVAVGVGAESLSELGKVLQNMISGSDRISTTLFNEGGHAVGGALLLEIFRAMGLWFLIPALVVLLAILARRGFVVSPDKLMPKLSRISPISNAKNKFGRSGLFEFGKSFVKLLIYSIVLGVFLVDRIPLILGTIHMSGMMVTALLLEFALAFFAIVLTVSVVIGVIDFGWQHQEYIRKKMMSRKELTDEAKQNEGDPHVKQQRRQKGYEIAMNQMLADVPDADVVIVNPLHYAVALKWNRGGGGAPVCVAKGVDEIAFRIREVAAEAGVPVRRDPPTARALFAVVEIGEEIRIEHYKAVAAAIRFAGEMRKKAGAMRGAGYE
jgi:flagellar biosynthetic protein FlhB